MHRSRRFVAPVLLGIALAAVAAVTPAQATDLSKGQWEFGGDLVRSFYDNDSTFSDTFSFAVRGGYFLQPRHEFELVYNPQRTDQDIKGSSEKFSIDRISLDYVGNFKMKKPDSKFAAYALFGLGFISYSGNGGSDSTLLFRGGGGTRYFFTKSIALRVEGALAQFHGDGTAIPRRGFFDFDFAVGVSFFVGGK